MSLQDKNKWDSKYLKKSQLLKPRDASANLKDCLNLCSGTKALDLACGAGRNSIYLARCGFQVDSLDIAAVAIEALEAEAKKQNLTSNINTFLVDLDSYKINLKMYDIIVMANFLDRDILKRAKDALKTNGILFVETYMISDENEKSKSDLNNLLRSQELKQMLDSSFEILHYDEFKNEDYEIYEMKKQVIVARKIENE